MIESLVKPVISKLPAYITGETIESVKEKYSLTEVHKLASNENQLGTSPKAIAAMQESLSTVNQYPDPRGLYLRRRLVEEYAEYGLTTDHIVATEGATAALNMLGEVFICPGDEVLYCVPTYPAYRGIVIRNSGIPVEIPMGNTLTNDLDALKKAITDKTKLIFICNPNNPTGTIVKCSELKEFLSDVPDNVIVVVDEAYFEFITDKAYESMASMVAAKNNLVVLRTFSKLYGLAGARVGYAMSSPEICNMLQKAAPFFCTNRMALAGAIAALDDTEFAEETVNNNRKGCKYLTEELTKLGWKMYDSHANFIYGDSGLDTMWLAEELKKKGLIVRGNFIFSRITIGTEYQNKLMVEAIKEVMQLAKEENKKKAV